MSKDLKAAMTAKTFRGLRAGAAPMTSMAMPRPSFADGGQPVAIPQTNNVADPSVIGDRGGNMLAGATAERGAVNNYFNASGGPQGQAPGYLSPGASGLRRPNGYQSVAGSGGDDNIVNVQLADGGYPLPLQDPTPQVQPGLRRGPIVGTRGPVSAPMGGGFNARTPAPAMPVQPMQPAPSTQAAQSLTLGNAAFGGFRDVMGERQQNMAAQENFADGGTHEGMVRGPGTGVSDSIPAMISKGEYVVPADTVQAIGKDNLDAVKDATHTPAAVQRGLRGGMAHFADGTPDGVQFGIPKGPPRLGVNGPRPNFTMPPSQPAPPPPPNTGMSGPIPGSARYNDFEPNFAPPKPDAAPNPAGMRDINSPPPAAAPAEGPGVTTVDPHGAAYQAGKLVSRGIKNAPGGLGSLMGGISAYGPHWDALSKESTLTWPEQAQLFARDTGKLAGGVVGGVAGGAIGLGLGGPVGAALGGGAVGYAGMNSMDRVMDDVRRGTNKVNEMLGGSKDYFEDSDKTLARNGFDPNRSLGDMVMQKDPTQRVQLTPGAAKRVANGELNEVSDSYPDATGSMADSIAARNAPPTDNEAAMAGLDGTPGLRRFGQVSVDQQRSALNTTASELRGNKTVDASGVDGAYGQKAINVDGGNTNLRASLRGMGSRPVQVNDGYGNGGDKIYAQKDANGHLVLSGVGDGSANAKYKQSDQYKDGVARAQADKTALGQIEYAHQEQDLKDNLANSSLSGLRGNKMALAQHYARQTQDAALQKDYAIARNQQNFTHQENELNRGMKERELQLQTAQFGETVGKNELEAQQSAQKSLADKITSETPMIDGKPDTALIAKKTDAINSRLGQRQQQLQAQLQLHPDDATAKNELHDIVTRGTATIPPAEYSKMMAGVELKHLQEQNSTSPMNPVGGTDIDSKLPARGIRYKSGYFGTPFGAEYQVDNGEGYDKGGTIPARVVKGSIIGRNLSNRFNILDESK